MGCRQYAEVFIFLDDYPESGTWHQNIAEYLARKPHTPQSEADCSFEKLCNSTELDPVKLQDLFNMNEHETRNQLANRAGALATSEIKRLWKDRPLKVRFNLDAQHLDTLVSGSQCDLRRRGEPRRNAARIAMVFCVLHHVLSRHARRHGRESGAPSGRTWVGTGMGEIPGRPPHAL